jgi:hypothetical protein
MKKFLAIVISTLFVLGLACSAFAIHAEIPSETQAVVAKGETQITLGGSIRVRGEARNNTSDFNDDIVDHRSAYDQRVRLSLDATVSDNVQGFVQLEAGDGDTADTWTWGDANGATGTYPKGNAKRGEVGVLQAWLLYTNDIANLKVGHMPLALGNLLFFDHRKFGDDAILIYKDIENIHLAALTIKFEENGPVISDDANAYVGLAVLKGEGFNAGADITWVNDNSGFLAPDEALDLFNVGLRADATFGTVSVKGDVEFQTGNASDTADFAGYAVFAGLDVDLGTAKVALEGGVGSGDDTTTADDIETFITSLSSGVPYIGFVYGTRAASACLSGTASNPGICNTTYVKFSASGNATDAFSLRGDVIWLSATEDVSIRGGTPDTDLGFEIDAKGTYDLARNLKYWVEGGYLFVGDAYNDAADSADDAYAVRHGIELTF